MTAEPPYRTTPIFNDVTLRAALRHPHRTKPSVWGVVRALAGRVRYAITGGQVLDLGEGDVTLIIPDQEQGIESLDTMRIQVELYRARPNLDDGGDPVPLASTKPVHANEPQSWFPRKKPDHAPIERMGQDGGAT